MEIRLVLYRNDVWSAEKINDEVDGNKWIQKFWTEMAAKI